MSFRIVVLISGSGTTLLNLLQRKRDGKLQAEVVHVISNRGDAGGLKHAEDFGIPRSVINLRDFDGIESFSQAIFDRCRDARADLVVMGGFLKQLLIPVDFENRVINIHPSLIPAFSGKGMFGKHVHSAVLAYGCKLTGCTVHFVDNQYDHGPIIAQQAVPVQVDDSPETLAKRVFASECELFPSVINAIAQNKVRKNGRLIQGF